MGTGHPTYFLAHNEDASRPNTWRIYAQGLAWFLRAFGDRDWEQLERSEVRRVLELLGSGPDENRDRLSDVRRSRAVVTASSDP